MSGKPLKNPRHEAFARHYVRLGIARHAYVAAGYSAALGDDPGASYPADRCATRLSKRVQVAKRIETLRQAMAKRADITEDSIADELEQARKLAMDTDSPAAAVSATVAKAKLAGLMIDRKEVGDAGDFARMTEQELRDYLSDAKQTADSQVMRQEQPGSQANHPGTDKRQ